jgi:hypothetical protein
LGRSFAGLPLPVFSPEGGPVPAPIGAGFLSKTASIFAMAPKINALPRWYRTDWASRALRRRFSP